MIKVCLCSNTLIAIALIAFLPQYSKAELVLNSVNFSLSNTGTDSTYSSLVFPAIGQLVAVDFPGPIPAPPRPARTATLDYALTQSDGVAAFEFTQSGSFAHDFFLGNAFGFSASNNWSIGGMVGGSIPMMSFSVNRPSTYQISGNYLASMTGLFPSQLSSTNYFVQFLEFENGNFGATPNVLFRHQLSDNLNGASGSFIRDVSIGLLAGAPNEVLEGSLTGILLPGSIYGISLSFGAQALNPSFPSNIVGSTSGSFAMTVTAIPEPSSAILILLAAGATGWRRIRFGSWKE